MPARQKLPALFQIYVVYIAASIRADKGLHGGIRLAFRVVQNAFFEQTARRIGYRFEESVSDTDIVIMPVSILVSYILSRILSDT